MVADREYPCWRWGRYPMVHHCREKAVRPGLSRGTRLGFILPLTIQDPEPYKTRNHTRPVAPCRHGPMGDGNPGPRRTPGSNSRPAPGPKLWAKTLGQNSGPKLWAKTLGQNSGPKLRSKTRHPNLAAPPVSRHNALCIVVAGVRCNLRVPGPGIDGLAPNPRDNEPKSVNPLGDRLTVRSRLWVLR